MRSKAVFSIQHNPASLAEAPSAPGREHASILPVSTEGLQPSVTSNGTVEPGLRERLKPECYGGFTTSPLVRELTPRMVFTGLSHMQWTPMFGNTEKQTEVKGSFPKPVSRVF
jgi:hypothetical protein